MLELISSLIFAASIAAILLYFYFTKDKPVSLHELSEVKRWGAKGYITKAQMTDAVTSDGQLTVKGYMKLKAIVDRHRMIRTLAPNEKSTKPKIHTETQAGGTEGGQDNGSASVEAADSRLVEVPTLGMESI